MKADIKVSSILQNYSIQQIRSKSQRFNKIPSSKNVIDTSRDSDLSTDINKCPPPIASIPPPSIKIYITKLQERVLPTVELIGLMKETEEWWSVRDRNRFNNPGLLESYLQPSLWLTSKVLIAMNISDLLCTSIVHVIGTWFVPKETGF